MPLGFAKSTFTYAAASAGAAVGWWTQAGTVNTNNNVAQKYTYGAGSQPSSNGGKNAVGNNYTFACWFRAFSRTSGNDSSNPDDFDPDFQEVEFMRMSHNDYNFIVGFHENNGIQAMLFGISSSSGGSDGGGTTFSTGNLSGNFRTTYCDNNWHHLYVQARFGTSTSESKIYLDGVDKTTNTLGDTQFLAGSSSWNSSGQVVTFGGRDGSAAKESQVDLTQVYFEPNDSQNNLSNVSRFYDSGYVDMGTDGDDSGLTTPDVFLYVNSTPAVVQGGNATGTLGLTTSNTMTVNASGGPS